MGLRQIIDKADNNSLAMLLQADNIEKNFNIIDIEPFTFLGTPSTSPLYSYANNIIYFSAYFQLSSSGVAGSLLSMSFYDRLDAIRYQAINTSIVYDGLATVIKYGYNVIDVPNIYFSRIFSNAYTRCNFIGYKITYTP